MTFYDLNMNNKGIMTIKSLAFTTGGTIYVVSVSLLSP